MRNKGWFNLFFVVCINLIIKPLWIFGVEVSVQNAVSLEQYGWYFSAFNLSILLNSFLDLGISQFNVQHMAKRPVLFNKYFAPIMGLKWTLSGIYIIFLIILGLNTREALDIYMLLALGIAQISASLLQYVRSNISAAQDFIADSVFSVLDKLLLLLLGFILLSQQHHFSQQQFLRYFSFAQGFSFSLTLLLAWIYQRRWVKSFSIRFSLVYFRAILRRSLPFAVYVLLMSILVKYDAYIVQNFYDQGAYQVGVYARYVRWVDALNMFGFLLSGILFPLLSKWVMHQPERVPELLRHAFTFLWLVLIPVCFVFTVYAKDISMLFYPDTQQSEVLSVLIWTLPSWALHHVFSSYLTALGKTKNLIFISGVVLLLNLCLHVFIYDRQSLLAVVFIQCVCQYIMGFYLVFKSSKYTQTSWRYFISLKHVFYFVFLGGFTWVFYRQISNAYWGAISIAFSALIILLSLGFLSDLKRMAKIDLLKNQAPN